MPLKIKLFACSIALSCCTATYADLPKPEKQLKTGYKNPEAIAIDHEENMLYISVPGELNGKDGDGFIARTSLSGEFKTETFIDKLNGPKGSQIVGRELFVVESNEVLKINLDTQKIDSIKLEDASFLLDLAVDQDGNIFVTDAPANAIYKISADSQAVSTFIQDEALAYPNGIEVMKNGDLLIAGWGKVSDPNTWETSEPGHFAVINAEGEITQQSKPLGHFDGLEAFKEHYIAVDFNTGKTFIFDPENAAVKEHTTYGEGVADIIADDSGFYGINYNTTELFKYMN